MSDPLLPYYNRELAFFRRLGAEFAAEHPKIAGRLRLDAEGSEDPHVARLIEGFAYLNARIRHKIDDDFPELAEAILGVLYPHYLRPIPSMMIVRFALGAGQATLTQGHTIARGTVLETEPVEGEPCRFRTCYPVTVYPVELESASLRSAPFEAPRTAWSSKAAAVLRLRFRALADDVPLGRLETDSLRFFIKAASHPACELYELLFNHVRQIALAASPREPLALLGPEAIRPVGFELDEGLFPTPPQSFPGFRLLTEFFTFPEKFLFFELKGLDRDVLNQAGNRFEAFIYLDRTSSALEENVAAETFQLGCTPAVNLFKQRAEPIPLTHLEHRYRVVPDARRPLANEVYSVDSVIYASPDGEETEYAPFYSFRHDTAGRQATFWWPQRRQVQRADERIDRGTEVELSLVDLDFQPSDSAEGVLHVETTCLNRDLPHRLPFGGGQPRLFLTSGGPLAPPVCLTPPTPTLRPPLRHGTLWRLISHLAYSRWGLLGAGGPWRASEDIGAAPSRAWDGENAEGSPSEAAAALREILRLYDFADSSETRMLVEGVVDVATRRVVGRVSGGVCRGVEVALTLDEDRFTGSGVYLFAAVLERFFGLSSSLNAFSQLVLRIKQREGVVRRWPPRAGEQVLL